MHRAWILGVAVLAMGGCGGHYILTVPDQLAPAGKQATVIVRLQRNDFFVLSLATEEALIRFRLGDGPHRAAYTDELGYAGANVPVPAKPGRYALAVAHDDHEGDHVAGQAPVYVRKADAPLVAVDLDSLPTAWTPQGKVAVAAVAKLAAGAGIVYMTRADPKDLPRLHERLTDEGYPDGPILLWQRKRWHIVRAGKGRLPRVVVESRLINHLGALRQEFPGLTVGVCGSALSAKAFAEAGMKCVLVGGAPAAKTNVTRRADWAELRDKGL